MKNDNKSWRVCITDSFRVFFSCLLLFYLVYNSSQQFSDLILNLNQLSLHNGTYTRMTLRGLSFTH